MNPLREAYVSKTSCCSATMSQSIRCFAQPINSPTLTKVQVVLKTPLQEVLIPCLFFLLHVLILCVEHNTKVGCITYLICGLSKRNYNRIFQALYAVQKEGILRTHTIYSCTYSDVELVLIFSCRVLKQNQYCK
jgi:hypothetical protein